ncbi:hypothetical protein IKG60_00130 [Candidatus Saccharibacteria bacterium]|nr:hypothetical protein [Candidatus Saccharibacteria bacterium]
MGSIHRNLRNSSSAIFAREVTPLLNVKDAYPKLLIARTKQPVQNCEEIEIIDIADFLNT